MSLTDRESVFFFAQSDEEASLFESQLPTIISLTKGCKSGKVVRSSQDIPAGCGSTVLTPSVSVHLLVRVSYPSLYTQKDIVLYFVGFG